MIGAVLLFAKRGVLKGMSVSGVDRSVQRRSLLGSWGEDMELMTGPDSKISEEVAEQIERGVDSKGVECPVGHAGDDLSKGRVLILLKVFWKSASNSGVWRSSELVHES